MGSKNNKKSFVIYVDMLEILDELSDEQAGQLFRAIQSYHIDDKDVKPPEVDQIVRVAFSPFKRCFDRDATKYNEVVNRNRINGAKGGRPPKPNKPSGFLSNPKNLDSDNDSDNDKGENNKRTAKRFIPPTLDEVRDYITQKGYTINPQSFIDYYTSNGWRVGKNPMKNWKAAVSSWNSRDDGNRSSTTNPNQEPQKISERYELL